MVQSAYGVANSAPCVYGYPNGPLSPLVSNFYLCLILCSCSGFYILELLFPSSLCCSIQGNSAVPKALSTKVLHTSHRLWWKVLGNLRSGTSQHRQVNTLNKCGQHHWLEVFKSSPEPGSSLATSSFILWLLLDKFSFQATYLFSPLFPRSRALGPLISWDDPGSWKRKSQLLYYVEQISFLFILQ